MGQIIKIIQTQNNEGSGSDAPFEGLWSANTVIAQKVPLIKGVFIVGRGKNTAIERFAGTPFTFIQHESSEISRVHLKIEVTQVGSIFLTDLGSKNKTRLNGVIITERTDVTIGDIIQLSTTTKLCIMLEHNVPHLWVGTI